MPLTARCHSLRPDKTTGWLVYFELKAMGSRSGHFLVVGPGSIRGSEDVKSALRAGQAAVRYLKEVPGHAPPVTLLEATARILSHESESTGTQLEFGCAVLEREELWLLTRGAVRMVPLGEHSVFPLGAEKPHAIAVAAGDRFFLGRLRAEEMGSEGVSDLISSLEHRAGGDGGLVMQLLDRGALRAVPETEPLDQPKPKPGVREFESVVRELQHTFDFHEPEPTAIEEVHPGPPSEPSPEAPDLDLVPTASSDPESRNPPPEEIPETTVEAHSRDEGAIEVAPDPPQGEPEPTLVVSATRTPVYAPEETRGLGFWLSVVGAGLAFGALVTYLVFLRPRVQEESSALVASHEAGIQTQDPSEADPRPLWEDQFTEAITSSPLIVDDKVVFGCRDGRVYALNRQDGRRVWAYAASAGFGSSPVLAGKLVILGGYDGNLYALDAATGEERWAFKTQGKIVGSPSIDETNVYIGSYDHHIYAIARTDGAVRWSRDLGSVVWASPVYGNGIVFAAGLDGRITAMDPDNGRVHWRGSTGGSIYSSPTLGGESVYLGSKDGHLYAFDQRTGALEWKVDAGAEVNGSPAVHRDRVVVGADNGLVLCVSADDGKVLWKVKTGGMIKSRPAFHGDLVWITGYDGYLHAIHLESGEEVQKIQTDSSSFSSPTIADAVAYFGAMDGRFFAIRIDPRSS